MRPHAIDDGISQKAFARFTEMLDPGKLLLLKSQVTALEQSATQLDDELRAGDFRTARTGVALVQPRERAKKVGS